MPDKPPLNPKLQKLYEAAKRLEATRVTKQRLEQALAAWPTKKVEAENQNRDDGEVGN